MSVFSLCVWLLLVVFLQVHSLCSLSPHSDSPPLPRSLSHLYFFVFLLPICLHLSLFSFSIARFSPSPTCLYPASIPFVPLSCLSLSHCFPSWLFLQLFHSTTLLLLSQAETFKYLYLLFADDADIPVNMDDYVFTTEAHPLPLSLASMPSDVVRIWKWGSGEETHACETRQVEPRTERRTKQAELEKVPSLSFFSLFSVYSSFCVGTGRSLPVSIPLPYSCRILTFPSLTPPALPHFPSPPLPLLISASPSFPNHSRLLTATSTPSSTSTTTAARHTTTSCATFSV